MTENLFETVKDSRFTLELPESKQILNLKEAAMELGISRYKLVKALEAQGIEPIKALGHRLSYITREQVQALKQQNNL